MALNCVEGPDFICIGMPKAATGWLFDQMKYHPDFWIPPVKELAYLTKSARLKRVQERLKKIRSEPNRPRKFLRWSDTAGGNLKGLTFLKEAAATIGKRIDLRDYARLFRHKDHLLSGDFTSAYSALEGEMISELDNCLPETRIVFLARDPVERAWSHISMWCRNGALSPQIGADPKRLSAFLERNQRFARLAFPSQIAARWREKAPHLQFRTFFFDSIAGNPEQIRREIFLYLGADPAKKVAKADRNRKSSLEKLPFLSSMRSVLVNYFREELRICADQFGGVAKTWPCRYGITSERNDLYKDRAASKSNQGLYIAAQRKARPPNTSAQRYNSLANTSTRSAF